MKEILINEDLETYLNRAIETAVLLGDNRQIKNIENAQAKAEDLANLSRENELIKFIYTIMYSLPKAGKEFKGTKGYASLNTSALEKNLYLLLKKCGIQKDTMIMNMWSRLGSIICMDNSAWNNTSPKSFERRKDKIISYLKERHIYNNNLSREENVTHFVNNNSHKIPSNKTKIYKVKTSVGEGVNPRFEVKNLVDACLTVSDRKSKENYKEISEEINKSLYEKFNENDVDLVSCKLYMDLIKLEIDKTNLIPLINKIKLLEKERYSCEKICNVFNKLRQIMKIEFFDSKNLSKMYEKLIESVNMYKEIIKQIDHKIQDLILEYNEALNIEKEKVDNKKSKDLNKTNYKFEPLPKKDNQNLGVKTDKQNITNGENISLINSFNDSTSLSQNKKM